MTTVPPAPPPAPAVLVGAASPDTSMIMSVWLVGTANDADKYTIPPPFPPLLFSPNAAAPPPPPVL